MRPPRGPEQRIDTIETPEDDKSVARSTGSEAAAASAGEASPAHPGVALWVATAGGVGFGPWAPGTWGALLAVILFGLLFERVGLPLYVLLVVALTLVGIWSASAVESWFGRPDDGRIVIDEVVGQLITLAPLVLLHGLPLGRLGLPPALSELGAPHGIDIGLLLLVTGFVAFRWFDIRKPGPVKWAEERFEGGVGVMADDIVAGLLGALVVTLPAYLAVVARLHEIVRDPGLLGLGARLSALLAGGGWPS